MNSIQQGANYIKEMGKRLSKSKAHKSEDDVKPGEGKVVEWDNKQVAVYKDDSGNITRLSAVCTHLGCIVDFNSEEKTWDCPCHGSRFNVDGSVLRGPAQKPLRKFEK